MVEGQVFADSEVLAHPGSFDAGAAGRSSPSIVFLDPDERRAAHAAEMPDVFADLNLDQVLESITTGREGYDLKPFFYIPLPDVAAVRYRHEVLSRDLETQAGVSSRSVRRGDADDAREHLARVEQLHATYQQEGLFLDAVEAYCDAVGTLAEELALLDLTSRGLLMFRAYLADYTASDGFTSLAAEMRRLKGELAKVKYCVNIRGTV